MSPCALYNGMSRTWERSLHYASAFNSSSVKMLSSSGLQTDSILLFLSSCGPKETRQWAVFGLKTSNLTCGIGINKPKWRAFL